MIIDIKIISNNPVLQNTYDILSKEIIKKSIDLTSCEKVMFYDITRLCNSFYKNQKPLNDQKCNEKQFYIGFIMFALKKENNEYIICIH